MNKGVNRLRRQSTKALWAAWISLFSNVLLTIGKIMIGYLMGSPSLLADGIHNAADVLASAASLFSMRISQRPADLDHPYGHGKAEIIASAIVAMILAFAAVYMIFEAVQSFFEPVQQPHLLALLAGIVSIIWKQVLYVYTMRIGKEEKSKGLIATAYDHLSDVYASFAVVVGVGSALLSRYLSLPFLRRGDSIASVIVSLLILYLAYRMAREAVDVLMEKSVSEEMLKQYQAVIMQVPLVKRIDNLRARDHGHYILIDVRVSVPGDLTVKKGHDVTKIIQKRLLDGFEDVQEVLVHVNPWNDEG
jgi:cation diffusion facilitator family transporter